MYLKTKIKSWSSRKIWIKQLWILMLLKRQVVLGVVNGIKPWGAYVTIAPGLDALCPYH